MPDEHDHDSSPLIGIIAIFGGMALLLILVLAGRPQSLPLTETFTSEDGTFSFNYPEGWVVEGANVSYHVANNPEAFTSPVNIPNTIALSVSREPISVADLGFTTAPSQKPIDGLEGLIQWISEDSPDIKTDKPLEFFSHGRAGARVRIIPNTMFIVLEDGYNGLYLIFATSNTNIRQFEPTIMAITQSLQYTPVGN